VLVQSPLVVTKVFTPGVAAENRVSREIAAGYRAVLDSSRCPKEYVERGPSTAFEYARLVGALQQLKILDVGAGRGESSVFLAERGNLVYALDPSPDFCALIADAAAKFGLAIVPVQGVAEDIEHIGENKFDVAIFNCSLHHCDSPERALGQAFSVLKEGGSLILCSEPTLRPWISKGQWHRLLETQPEKMGHYGGNEHIYYNWQYKRMLKAAGFTKIKKIAPSEMMDALGALEKCLTRRIKGKRAYSELQILERAVYYFIRARLVKAPWSFHALAAVSLVPVHFSCIKPRSDSRV
jgi:ubiquinone/menaquinone biosynthesis C-methylase UbiE